MQELEYPCGQCSNEVSHEDKAILCEGGCQSCFHAECMHITDEQYDRLIQCPACRKDGLPPFNSVDTGDTFNFDFQQILPTPN